MKSQRYKYFKYRLWQLWMFPYYALVTFRPVWNFLNRKRTRAYQAYTSNVSEVQKNIVETLERDGIAITHIDELFPGGQVFGELKNEVNRLLETNLEEHTKKAFLQEYLRYDEIKSLDNPFVRFALQSALLETASAFFGMFAKLTNIFGNITIPVKEGDSSAGSQRWHRDPGFFKLCKVFLYLNDVEEGGGPFIYIKGSQPGGTFSKKVKHRYFGVGSYYPREGLVESMLKEHNLEDQLIKATGKAGTLVFCNTAGLHKGGYSTMNERIMLTTYYRYLEAGTSAEDTFPENFKEQFSKLSSIAKHSLD